MTNESFTPYVGRTYTAFRHGAVERCAQCGFAIDARDDFVTVSDTGDRIHRDCWEEYASDNAEEFFVQTSFS